MSKLKKYGLITLSVAIVIAILSGREIFTAFMGWRALDGLESRSTAVREGSLNESVSAPGFVEPVSKVDISAQISARVMALPLREGDVVHKGDLVVQLDDRNLKAVLASTTARRDGERARLEAERARIEGPKQSLENSKRNLERQRKLFETGDVARQALEDAMVKVQEIEAAVVGSQKNIGALESSLAASEAEIERVREEVSYATIRAPIDGTITRLNAEVGELVVVGTMNNAGTVIMTIANLARMRVRAQVAEADIAKVLEGQPAEIFINAFSGRSFHGVVEEVALQRTSGQGSAASATQGSGTFKVDVSLDTEGTRIFSGLAANVDIAIKEHRGMLVPTQAIVERKRDDLPAALAESTVFQGAQRVVAIVFLDENGVAVATPVRLGSSSLTETIVEMGLSAGQSVVVGPYKTLEQLKGGEKLRKETIAPAGAGKTAGKTSSVSVKVGA
ncbi:MAG: efflux RND transporter periplasmic adaptor subunit [Planctomycetes bacterium]|nr:efflux RND transporter periplasmic adaptor subunit [Planctomycetota bacterium]